MANPNNAVGTNAAFSGRTSPNAFNDVLGAFAGRGILSGWQIAPNTGMTVALGGDGENRDVALAEDNAGNKTTINNIPATPISLTIEAAPATNSRIDAIVAYVNNPPQGATTETDNFGAVGLLDVQGGSASSPVAPDDSAIRSAITADGASGATAYYVVLGYVTIASGTTDITANMITQGANATLLGSLIQDLSVTTKKIADEAVSSQKIDWTTITGSSQPSEAYSQAEVAIGTWIDGKTIYRKVIPFTNLTPGGSTILDIGSTPATLIDIRGTMYTTNFSWQVIPRPLSSAAGYETSVGDVGSSDIGGGGHFRVTVGNAVSSTNYGFFIATYTKS